MALISLQDIRLGFGGAPLLDGTTLQIEEGERICILGRNGAGKSTLLKLVEGLLTPDGGELVRQQGLRVESLSQEVPKGLDGSVSEVIAGALDEEYNWEDQQRIEKLLSRMSLDGDAPFANLSAGLKRRVLLARGLVTEPHLLLLDEPTNHLDIDSILWLEDFLIRYGTTLLFITHDRAFLQRLATRIVELDRGRLINWDCNYSTYLERKDAMLEAEDSQNARFDKKLAEEEVWIRKGIKARRTRNEGRVRALEKMREERQSRRTQTGNVSMKLQDARKSGRIVVEAEGVTCGYGDKVVARDLSTIIMRGDKVGIMGPNGAGKTTLLKTLLGQLEPLAGGIKLGTRLEIAYFDQLRSQLDENKTVQENVGEGNDQVIINGKPRHIIGYLQDFLFTPDRARSPVKVLSGGERNRLLLAKLFTRPSNMIVMDEPTNDLDMETLDLLEELLIDYSGTLLLVSHDRSFLNDIVTSTLVFEGDERVEEYIGGYDDWLRQRKVKEKTKKKGSGKSGQKDNKPRKMSFKEKAELEELPLQIETLDAKKEELYKLMAEPEIYQQRGKVSELKAEAEETEETLARAYKRWEELEAIKEVSEK